MQQSQFNVDSSIFDGSIAERLPYKSLEGIHGVVRMYHACALIRHITSVLSSEPDKNLNTYGCNCKACHDSIPTDSLILQWSEPDIKVGFGGAVAQAQSQQVEIE